MTSTPLAPPPAPPAPGAAPQPTGPRTSSRVVSILVAVVGGAIVLGTLATVALSTIALAGSRQDATTVQVAGVDALDIDVSGGSLIVAYADVRDARLTVDRGMGSSPWTFENRDGTLTIASPDRLTSFGWPFGGNGTARLTLPASLRASAVDARVQVDGGSVRLTGGRFDDLQATTDAGSLRISGAARTVTGQSNAGDSQLVLRDVESASIDVSAGRTVATLKGTAPHSIDATVSAGLLQLGVPAGAYDVTSNVSAGAFHNALGSTPGAANTIRAEVSAGALELSSR
jgi:hypothetical protein